MNDKFNFLVINNEKFLQMPVEYSLYLDGFDIYWKSTNEEEFKKGEPDLEFDRIYKYVKLYESQKQKEEDDYELCLEVNENSYGCMDMYIEGIDLLKITEDTNEFWTSVHNKINEKINELRGYYILHEIKPDVRIFLEEQIEHYLMLMYFIEDKCLK